jgi:hypothetical protein
MFFTLGAIRYKQGRWDDAIQDYTYAIERDQKNVGAWVNRGEILLDQGEVDRALEDLRAAIELDPGVRDKFANRARMLVVAIGDVYPDRLSDCQRIMGTVRLGSDEDAERVKKVAKLRERPPKLGATASPSPPAGKVFLSYRRAETADVTGRIWDRFTAQLGRDRVFRDVSSVPLGIDFVRHIQEQVERCVVLVAVIGRDWTTVVDGHGKRRLDDPADFVRLEIEAALERKVPIIPVLVQGASMPLRKDLPDSLIPLLRYNGSPVRADPDFGPDMERLIAGVEALIRSTGAGQSP